jgi:tRNA(Ile)-lysidine synthase
VLPQLESINPKAAESIAHMAGVVAEEDELLNSMAAAALERAEIPLNGELGFLTSDIEAAFSTHMLTHAPAPLVKRGLRLAAKFLGADWDSQQLQVAWAGISAGSKGSVTGEGGDVVLEWTPETIHMRQLAPTEPFRFNIVIPGEVASDEFGWRITAEHVDPIAVESERKSMAAVMDMAKIVGQTYFRSAKPGDTISPLGFAGKRKLSDLLSEAGLTKAARQRLPIVCDMLGPIWAPGVCLEERVKTTESIKIAIRMCFSALTAAESRQRETAIAPQS